jgi:ribonuclease BN (tRNA processing enzyme)
MYAPSDEDDDLGDSFEFHEFVPDVMKIGPFSVTVTPATHPVDAFSIRVDAGGKSLTFTGDTGPSQGLIDLARGSGLLLAEASFLEGGKNPPNLHLTAREAVAHGVQAGVDDIVLTHFVPWNDLNDTVTEAQAARDEFGFDGDLQLAHSGLVVEL